MIVELGMYFYVLDLLYIFRFFFLICDVNEILRASRLLGVVMSKANKIADALAYHITCRSFCDK